MIKNKKNIVITYGTFDMFHIGHLLLLQRLKELGDTLIVGVSTDEFNQIKGKKTLIPYKDRATIVENIKCVDFVLPETDWNQKIIDIKKYNVDIFAIGDDWRGKFDFLSKYCQVIYLERTADISTTFLKNTLNSISKIPNQDIGYDIEVLEQIKKNFE